jgi:hypothetical protein
MFPMAGGYADPPLRDDIIGRDVSIVVNDAIVRVIVHIVSAISLIVGAIPRDRPAT